MSQRFGFGTKGKVANAVVEPRLYKGKVLEAPETHLDNPGGSREPVVQPGRPQRAIWTAREARETHLDSPLGSREPVEQLAGVHSPKGSRDLFGQPGRLGRLQGVSWTAWEAPEPIWTAREAPEISLGSREPTGQPGRPQEASGTAREAREGL